MNPRRLPTVCFFGYDERDEGGRTWTMRTGLAENGITIKFCQTSVNGPFAKYRDLYRKWKGIAGDIDVVYVTFMGYYLMPLAWYLARQKGILVILDTLVSQYDTEVVDRRRISRYSPRAWFLLMVDFIACALADAIVVDTLEHKKFFTKRFFVNVRKIVVVPVGCRSDLFKPLPKVKGKSGEFVVEFHGSFIPLQGVEYIIEAARILQNKHENVRFILIGDGQTCGVITYLAKELGLTNVEFLGKKPLEELPYCVARGDICLGIFGTTHKALRVVPNKVYECMSCGKPVITERSPAALGFLRDRDNVCMVEPGNGADLAEKILELKQDTALRTRLGERARAVSLSQFSPHMLVKPLVDWLESHV